MASEAPSDSQGDQERCKRCGGSKQIWEKLPSGGDHGPFPCPDCNPAPTQVEGDRDLLIRMGEGSGMTAEGAAKTADAILKDRERRLSDPSQGLDPPKNDPNGSESAQNTQSQPEGGDEEDWPEEVWAERYKSNRDLFALGAKKPRYTPGNEQKFEVRRYVPATSQDSSGLEEKLKAQVEIDFAEKLETTEEGDGFWGPDGEYYSDLSPREKALLEAGILNRRRADKAEAERDKQERARILLEYQRQDWQRDRERAETALEELATFFEREAEDALKRRDALKPSRSADRRRHEDVAYAYCSNAERLREKAAKLKEGKQ